MSLLIIPGREGWNQTILCEKDLAHYCELWRRILGPRAKRNSTGNMEKARTQFRPKVTKRYHPCQHLGLSPMSSCHCRDLQSYQTINVCCFNQLNTGWKWFLFWEKMNTTEQCNGGSGLGTPLWWHERHTHSKPLAKSSVSWRRCPRGCQDVASVNPAIPSRSKRGSSGQWRGPLAGHTTSVAKWGSGRPGGRRRGKLARPSEMAIYEFLYLF